MTGIFQLLAGGGGAAKIPIALTISANTTNYNIYDNRGGTYVAGNSQITLTINSGVVVYSTSTGSPALTTGNSWTSGDEIIIINNGTILGKGGNGGNGSTSTANPGTAAGGALQAQFAVSIDNQNRIAGGGGGGGGGAGTTFPNEYYYTIGGGGGGGGIGQGSGGSGAPSSPGGGGPVTAGGSGTAGTLTTAGSGGAGGTAPGGTAGAGGAGGTYGSTGSTGGDIPGVRGGGAGGGGGYAISGNSNITWINFGTRNGAIT